jgi:hypothetical protein
VKRFGATEVSCEITELLCITIIVLVCQGWISSSKYYRKAAHGAVVGCLASPALISAFQVHFGRTELSRVYLHLSMGCTLLVIVEAVHDNGNWHLMARTALQRAATTCAVIVFVSFDAPFPSWSRWLPSAVLACHHLVHRSFLRALPETFTLGEAAIMSTATTLLIVDTSAMLGAGCFGLHPVPRFHYVLSLCQD